MEVEDLNGNELLARCAAENSVKLGFRLIVFIRGDQSHKSRRNQLIKKSRSLRPTAVSVAPNLAVACRPSRL